MSHRSLVGCVNNLTNTANQAPVYECPFNCYCLLSEGYVGEGFC